MNMMLCDHAGLSANHLIPVLCTTRSMIAEESGIPISIYGYGQTLVVIKSDLLLIQNMPNSSTMYVIQHETFNMA